MSLYHASSRLWIAGLLTAASASLLLLGPGAAAAVGVPGRGQARQPFPTGISLNEFMPQPASDWNGDGAADQGDEYIEIYNANPFDVDISGWIIDDSADGGSSPYVLPPGAVVLAQRHLLLFATETGIDLADGDEGDELRLMTPDGVQVESYGYAEATPDGAYSKTADGSGAWTTGYPPSPGAANLPPAPATATNTVTATSTPTETGTPAASATPTPTPTVAPVAVSLNEFMPNPAADWNNDGILGDDNDEYIELYNANDFVVDLSGWKLDDVAGGGSSPYTLPGGTTIAAQGFLVFWSRDTNIALNNSGGDSVRLLTPDGVEVESHAYTAAPVDGAYSKTVDGGAEWTQVYPPSPGASNQPPVWTATPTATPTRTATPAPTPTATPGDYPDNVSLNEFMPNPESDWNGDGILGDTNDEYIELYNANDFVVDLSGWKLDDVAGGGSSPYTLPGGTTIAAHSFLVFWSRDTNIALNNSGGDSVRLLRPDGVEMESYAYTAAPADGAYSKTVDGGAEWTQAYPPSPGATNQAAPTATPTPTATPGVYPDGVSLNEYMPDPASDWNGDGAANQDDEYIELYNANDAAVDLSGWRLDDMDDGRRQPRFLFGPDGSPPYVLPAGTTIPAHGFLLLFRSQTGLALNNDGDWVRLLRPDGVVVEATEYSSSRNDEAASKTVDGGDQWTHAYPPSPGASNQPAPTTPTPTPTPIATPTPTATPGSYSDGVSLNEFMPNPASDWNNDGILGDENDEYIELYNANDFVVDLSGWQVDDVAGGGSSPYTLPAGTMLAARGFLPLWSRDTHIALNNSGGDSVRLLRPDGVEMESYAYTAAPADGAYSKTVDGGAEWTQAYPPSPGATNQAAPTATPTPTATPGVYPDGVSLNEYMPDPASDWNGDGAANQEDEYIELYNANDFDVDLSGWRLDDMDDGRRQPRFLFGPDGSPPYVLPAGTTIPAHGFLLLFRSQTGLALNNDGDWVRLLRPDGVIVEATEYSSSRNDEAASKTVDGGDQWTHAYPPSPGASNQPAPTTPTPTPTPIATPTPTATPGDYPDNVSLNEFMPNPESDWNDDGILGDTNDEYIELYNANDFVVDLSGWQVDDVAGGGSSPYTLPGGTTIAAHSFLVFWSRDTNIALNNSGGDSVRLLRPDGVEMESYAYTAAPADGAYSKTVDGGATWTQSYPPSPDATNQAAPTPTPTPTATPGIYPDGVSLNEFMPNPESDWNGDGILGDTNDEYIELYNANDFVVDLSGWQVDDVAGGGSTPYTLPAGTMLAARGFLPLWSRDTNIALNNSGGDAVRLLRPDGVEVESHAYTAAPVDGAYSKTVDGGAEWTQAYPPSPGASNQAAPTPTPTPTATPGDYPDNVSLNEFMPNPESDWNGDGILGDTNDEYIELYNANDFVVDLSGWQVDDVAGGGSTPYTLPAGTMLAARGFLPLWSRDTHIALNNSGGDAVRLLRPDGVEMESYAYTAAPADGAYSKTVDGGAEWTQAYPPSPGATNQAAPTATPTPTATPGVYPDGVSLNEYMPDPASDWNGDGAADQDDEYIELYNANDFDVDLSGWRLDDMDDGLRASPDGSPPYTLPAGAAIPARGFLLLFRSQTGIVLNNDGDWVRLLRPDGVVVEATEYSSSRDDQAASKVVDGGSEWTRSYPPSPGSSNTPGGTPTPTPTATPVTTPTPFSTAVRLNEVLASPRDVDWDGNGVPSYLDEWIELVNVGDEAVDLAGWKLADGPPAGREPERVYILPPGAVLPAHGYLLIFRGQSGLGLNASDEWVQLLHPDNSQADLLHYEVFSGYDQSWCRLPDGVGDWSRFCIESPGQPNQADPNNGGSSGGSSGSAGGSASGSGQPYDRFNYDLLSIAQARGLPDRARVTLEGQVTVLPDIFDDQNIYIQDASGGMLVYLRSGEWPPLSEGQWVRVNGRLDTFYGEREISLVRIDDIKTMQPAAPPAPLPIRTGEVNEANEGRLAQISGAITGYWKETTLYLDDGSGEARITIKPSTGLRRPYVVIGEAWTVVGVVSQSESGYRLLPRREGDLQRGRATAAGRAGTTARAVAVQQDDMAWNRAPIYLPITGAVLTVRPPAPATLWEAWLSIR